MRRLGNKGVTTCKITNHLYCKYFETRGTYCNITWYGLNNNLMFGSDLKRQYTFYIGILL